MTKLFPIFLHEVYIHHVRYLIGPQLTYRLYINSNTLYNGLFNNSLAVMVLIGRLMHGVKV